MVIDHDEGVNAGLDELAEAIMIFFECRVESHKGKAQVFPFLDMSGKGLNTVHDGRFMAGNVPSVMNGSKMFDFGQGLGYFGGHGSNVDPLSNVNGQAAFLDLAELREAIRIGGQVVVQEDQDVWAFRNLMWDQPN